MKKETSAKKRVAIKPKHAKAYRKRHYALLVTTLVAAFALFGLVISIRIQVHAGNTNAHDFIAGAFGRQPSRQQAVTSSYGFSFKYDPRRLYASAVDGSTGKLYIGYELASERPYQTIKLSTKAVPRVANDPDTVSLEYYQAELPGQSLAAIERAHIATKQSGVASPTITSTQTVGSNGLSFQRTTWNLAGSGQLASQLNSHFVSYTTVLNGQPLIIRTNNRLGSAPSSIDIDAIAQSLNTGQASVSYQAPTPAVSAKLAANRSLLDKVFFSPATADSVLDTQDISALYAPAVVKIYNAYCTDVTLNGQLYLSNVCAGTSGSGFFVGSDGYLATNGHVVTENPKDLVIEDAYTKAAAGNGKPLISLAQLAGLDLNELSNITDDQTLLDNIFSAVYSLPDSDFAKTNNMQNLLVGLDSKDPDVDRLLALTNARQQYAGNDDVVQAKLISADYRAADGIKKYRNSDVAILKLDGSNYPVVTLGDIAEVSQGSSLSILGYPAAASNNGIVAADQSAVTLTAGKVSAIKNANGDSHKLIETEATIGHGNSGGPAIDDSGHVIGIATYTIDGGGQGDGTFNYVRDIQDLKNLADVSHLTFQTQSQTQIAWQQAITAFDSAHYTKALRYFSQVSHLYPQHPTVGDFEQRAQADIREGKEVKDLPLGLIITGAAVAMLLASLAGVLIIRHHGKHQIYKLASGQVSAQPVDPAAGAVAGFYYPVQPAASKAKTPLHRKYSARSLHH